MNEVSMDRLSWVEYQARVREEHAPVFLPVGATEQHGPHLPLGTDAMLASAVANGVADKVKGWSHRRCPTATNRSPSAAAASTSMAPPAWMPPP